MKLSKPSRIIVHGSSAGHTPTGVNAVAKLTFHVAHSSGPIVTTHKD